MAYDFENCLDFDGTDDFIEIPSITLSGTFTVSVWVQLQTGAAGDEVILGGSTNDRDTWYIDLLNDPDRITFINSSGAREHLTLVTDLVLDRWYHILMGRNASNDFCVFVDGVASPDNCSFAGAQDITFTRIGVSGTINEFHGLMDDLVIWDGTAPTEAQAVSLFNRACGVDPTTVIASPDRWYKFNSTGTSTTATDDGSDAQNGVLTNFPSSGMWVDHLVKCVAGKIIQLNQTIHRANSY